MKKKWNKTAAIDFDGVIHRYVTPFEDPSIIPDRPVCGAFKLLWELKCAGWTIVIVSSRARQRRGRRAIREWIKKYGGPEYLLWIDKITDRKVPAMFYLDDRAVRFDGKFYEPHIYESMEPWNR
jgi:hypothetical protein